MSKLTIDQKADIMLEHLSRFVNIDWNQEDFYLNHIKDGFRDIERMEEVCCGDETHYKRLTKTI